MDRNSDRDYSRTGDDSTLGAGSTDVRDDTQHAHFMIWSIRPWYHQIITFVLSFHRLLANLIAYW